MTEAGVQSHPQLPHDPSTRLPGRRDCRANDVGRRSPAWRYNTESGAPNGEDCGLTCTCRANKRLLIPQTVYPYQLPWHESH